MVLTKQELIASLQHEVRILVHLAGKIDPAKLDYRPTPSQRSTLELLQYMAIMGPTQLTVIKSGAFNRESLTSAWHPAEVASKKLTFEQAVAAIQAQSAEYTRILNEWSDSDFRAPFDMFGNATTRGSVLINQVLCSHAAYRTQLFCYLKASGRDELNTMNLWAGMDGAMQ